MFTQEQISVSLRATEMITRVLRVTVIMDIEQLNSDILSMLWTIFPPIPPSIISALLHTTLYFSHTISNHLQTLWYSVSFL